MMQRKYYDPGSLNSLKQHIADIKTKRDLSQLIYDIKASGTNLTYVRWGVKGVWAIDNADGNEFRHIFMTRQAVSELGEPRLGECSSYTVLENDQDSPTI